MSRLSFKDGFLAAFSAALFGAILPLSFAPWNWWAISIVSIASLTLLLHKASPGKCFRRGLFFGLGMFGVGASWVYVSIHTYGNTAMPLAALMTAGFVLLLAIIFALPFTLLGLVHTHTTNGLLFGLPAIWVLGEMLRGWIFTGFPWLYLGYGFGETWLGGWAPIIGVYGISAIVVFAGALLALLAQWKKSRSSLEVALFFGAAIVLGGMYLKTQPWTTPSKQVLTVGLMQPAISLQEKWNKQHLDKTLSIYESLTNDLLENELIIWPESAIPAVRHDVKPLLEKLEKQMLDLRAGLITGIPTRTPSGKYYNTVIAMGTADGEYHKQHLVPFGEYVPFESILRPLQSIFNLPMSSFSSGPASQPPIYVQAHPVSTAICYEIAYTDLVRRLSAQTSFIVTVSNDAWFGDSIGPHQHLQIAQMRALENGKPVIRSTNDGISAIIDQKGRIQTSIPRLHRGTTSGWVIPHTGQSPYNKHGSVPILIGALLIFVISAFSTEPKKK